MSGVLTPPPRTDAQLVRTIGRIAGYLLVGLGVGGVAGIGWWLLVDLPGYRVASTGGASTTERGLTEFIGGDAWFTALGMVAGVLLGLLAWRLFRGIGWPVVVLAVLAAALAALACWLVGYQLGPGAFAPRLAAAQPGDFVPIELTVRAKASLLVWPFAATIPILLASSLGRDEETPGPGFRPRGG